MLRALITTVLAFAATPSPALDRWELYARGYWKVALVHFDSGRIACTLESETSDTLMNIWLFEDSDSAGFQYSETGFNWPPMENVPIRVDIDYEVYRGTATLDSESIMIGRLPWKFLADFAAGHAVALFDDSDARIVTYSLKGTAAGVEALLRCYNNL